MKKIMIVDDDVTSVAIVKALLEPEFEVVSAVSLPLTLSCGFSGR